MPRKKINTSSDVLKARHSVYPQNQRKEKGKETHR